MHRVVAAALVSSQLVVGRSNPCSALLSSLDDPVLFLIACTFFQIQIKTTKMSFQAEQLAALLRQTQQLAELKANALKYGSAKSVEEVSQEHENSRNSDSPKSNHSSSSDKVNNIKKIRKLLISQG